MIPDHTGRPVLRSLSPRRWSISTRLALWYGSSILLLLVGFSVLSYYNFHRSLHRDFDQHLQHELMVLLPLVDFDESQPVFARFEEMRSVSYQTDGVFGTFVRLIGMDASVVYESPNFQGHPPLPVEIPDAMEMVTVSRTWNSQPLRSHYHPLRSPDSSKEGWLEVSGYEWSMHQELSRLFSTFSIGIVIAVILSFAGGYLISKRALGPVAAITRAANEIRASSLDRRVPVNPVVRDELTLLAETVNELLARIEASFLRERRFSANAAHELVTPLAAVRGEVELTLQRSDIPAGVRPMLEAALGDVDRMSHIVRSLLKLASAERLERTKFTHVDFTTLVSEHVDRFSDRAQLEGKSITCTAAPRTFVRADEAGLGTVVDNLIDNALKYTDGGGHVIVRLDRTDSGVEFSVEDDGIGFSREDGENLFHRFFRANTVTVQARAGSGLGLAIVAAVARAFDGDVSAASEGPGYGSRFTVTLPSAAA